MLLKDVLGKEAISWICILTAVPMAAFGFFNSNGLPLEQYLFAVATTEWILPNKRYFETPAKKRERLAQANKKKKGAPMRARSHGKEEEQQNVAANRRSRRLKRNEVCSDEKERD